MPAPIDPKLREEIIADYVTSNSINLVRKKHSVSRATVRKIVGEAEAQINELRKEKQETARKKLCKKSKTKASWQELG